MQMAKEYKYPIDEMGSAYFLIQDNRIEMVSKLLADYLGYSKEELIGINFFDLILPEERDRIREFYEKRLAGQLGPKQYETVILSRNGISKQVEISTWLSQSNCEGQPAFAGIVTDTMEPGKSQEALKESDLKYRTPVENIPQRVFFKDTNSVYVCCNKNYAFDLGIEPAEISGKTDYDFFPMALADKYQLDDKRIIESGQGENLEEKYFKDKEDKIVQTVKIPINDTAGNVIGVLGIFDDITERKRSDEAIQESVQRLRLIFKCTPDGIVVTDTNAVITRANDQALKLYGVFHEGELIGKSGLELIAPRNRKKAMNYLHRCLDEGLILENEYSITRADGSRIAVETTAGRLRDESGNPVGLIAVVRDITQEKRIRENEQSYIFEAIKAQEEVKSWITRMLHDDTIQELLITTHRLQDVIEDNYGHLPKRAKKHLEETRLLTERVVSEIRNFITDIRPDVIDDMGLVPALRWLTGRIRDDNGIEARVIIFGDEKRLTPQTELNLFRIAQEALSNIKKHTNATLAMIMVEFGKDKLTLSISDNGSGFVVPDIISQFARQQKLGLMGIIERVQLLGGNYKIESSPGKGTLIKVEIDIKHHLYMPESPVKLSPHRITATSSGKKKSESKRKSPARKKRKP